ncbi:DUF2637 domain-containing protein [Streptomyces sp. NPDC088090]|uniref:DUF2637 domain-containing protein n=1 Tax=Streptomyces sp. NPDC088090 TaxID=3365822 RepID=UPI00384D6B29
MKLDTQRQVDQAEKILRLVWLIVFGAVAFSVLTVTPLVQRVTPDEWDWTAWLLPVVVDAAVVIVVRVDAIVARLDGRPGGWPAFLRWLTGGMTLLLNVGDSALKGDLVGVGVHAVAPVLLIVTAEAALGWRRAITEAVARIERERAAERERQQREREEREERSRADERAAAEAERAYRERQEQLAREREKDAAAERERQREHEARIAREAREHEAKLAQDAADRKAAAEQAARDYAARQRQQEYARADALRREQEEKAEKERKAAEAAKAAERDRKAAAVRQAERTPRPVVSAAVSTPAPETAHEAPGAAHEAPPAKKRLAEDKALTVLADALRDGRSQRQIVALTGWSAGWVAKHCQALTKTEKTEEVAAA